MMSVLLEPAATVVAVAAFTGLRLGELKGLVWKAYRPATEGECLGQLYVTRSIWRNVFPNTSMAFNKPRIRACDAV